MLFFSVHFKIANEYLMLNNVREIIVHIYIYTQIWIFISICL